MQTDRWQRAQRIFEQAVTLPTADRAAYVEAHCADDPTLRARIDRWLRADDAADGFLDEPLMPSSTSVEPDDTAPARLGAYRLLDRIGEGGMGTVYRARRDDDVFERDVAIKILSRFATTRESERRFRFERRVLAALDHRWIARVHDGGTTPSGLPYLVIEFVDGLPIDAYCDRHDLSIRDRLRLFRKVCAAVQASHQALIVHCDLKPSNILVNADGEPKLLDFGIAKLLGDEGFAIRDEPITHWPRPLTPQYASPEQLRGDVITTTSDVYALGVLLYKILTGQRPYELEGLTLVEAEARIAREPTRPSQTTPDFTHRSRRRGSRTHSQLTSDLDAIVLKALRPAPEDRYPSVEQLDADLGRYLDGFPVLARRGGLRYRATRFVRRHRLAVSVAATGLLALLAFAATMALMAERLTHEKARLQGVMDFALQIFQTAGPVGEYEQLSLFEAVDRNAALIETSFVDQPELRAGVLAVLGPIYLEFGDQERALALAEEARDLHASLYGTSSLEYHQSLDDIGAALREHERFEASKAATRQALSWFRRHAPDRPLLTIQSLNNLVATYCYAEDYKAAEADSEEALRLALLHLGERSLETAAATVQRGVVLRGTGHDAEAVALYRKGLERYQQIQGANHPYQGSLLSNLALIHRDLGEYDEAERHLRAADTLYRAAFGEHSSRRVRPVLSLATVAKERGMHPLAVERFREAVRLAIASDGPPSYSLRAASAFATYLLERDQCQEGIDPLRASLAYTREASTDSWRYYQLESQLGECLVRLGQMQEARPLLERSHRELVRLVPDDKELIDVAAERLALLNR